MKQYKKTVIAQQAIGEIVVGYKNKGVKVSEQPKILTSRDSAEFLRVCCNNSATQWQARKSKCKRNCVVVGDWWKAQG